MAKYNEPQLYVLFYEYQGKQEIRGIFDDEQKAVKCLESNIAWANMENVNGHYHTARMLSNLSKENKYTNIAIFSLTNGQEPKLYEKYWISTEHHLNQGQEFELPF